MLNYLYKSLRSHRRVICSAMLQCKMSRGRRACRELLGAVARLLGFYGEARTQIEPERHGRDRNPKRQRESCALRATRTCPAMLAIYLHHISEGRRSPPHRRHRDARRRRHQASPQIHAKPQDAAYRCRAGRGRAGLRLRRAVSQATGLLAIPSSTRSTSTRTSMRRGLGTAVSWRRWSTPARRPGFAT